MRWEYYVHTIDIGGTFRQGDVDAYQLTALLNQCGNDGWELVSSFDTNTGHGGSRLMVLMFKRPLSAAVAPPPALPPR